MKKSIKYILLAAFTACLFACEEQTMPESVRVQYPDEQSPILRDDAYYARLRAYKKTPHKLAFGWYGSWTAIGSSKQSHMAGVPDSMDIISVWSQWHSLSPEQIADKAFVQKTLGAKVVFCISAKDMPEVFKVDGEITEEGIVAYAKAWGKDSMDKYDYDGMDIDFETAIDHQGPMNTIPANFKKFAEELSQYIGPKSGTGRLFLIDGNVDSDWLPKNIAELCDYAVSQAYNCRSASDLEDRTASAGGMGWRPEQMIFTENFESNWQSGGPDYTCSDGVVRPSLLGMADFAKTSTSAGFGSYHMEYEYGNSTMPYKHMRQAIQLANPAPQGDYTKNMLTLNEAGNMQIQLSSFPSGAAEAVAIPLTGKLSGVVSADTDIPLKVDNALVASYNDYYYTEYEALAASAVTITGPLHFPAGSLTTDETAPATVILTGGSSLDPTKEYLVPIRADFSGLAGFTPNTAAEILYVVVKPNPDVVTNTVCFSDAGRVEKISIVTLLDGTLVKEGSYELSARTTYGVPEDVGFTVTVDASLVESYNQANGTSYAALAKDKVTVPEKLSIKRGQKLSDVFAIAAADADQLAYGTSMIALRLDLGSSADYAAAGDNALVKYIIVSKSKKNIDEGATSVDGTLIADRTGWTYTAPGATSLVQGAMFNGNIAEMGWYTTGKVTATVDMARAHTLAGFRICNIFGNKSKYQIYKLYDVQSSMDGEVWDIISSGEVIMGDRDDLGWQYVNFFTPVTCRYIRMTYQGSSAKDNFAGCNEFEAYEAKN